MNNSDKIYKIISTGTDDEKLAFLQQLPENTMKETAKIMALSRSPVASLLSFGSLLPSYCHGANCENGASLGLALYKRGKELYLSGNNPDLLLMTVLGYAHNSITALNNLGEYEAAEEFITGELPFWEEFEKNPEKLQVDERKSYMDNLKSILVARINILIQLNRIDDASELASDNDRVEGNWSSDIELNRLRSNLERIKTGAGELDKDKDQRRSETYADQESKRKNMVSALKKMLGQMDTDPKILKSLESSTSLDPYTRSGFEQLENILTKGESYLHKETSEVNELTVRQIIRRASGIFVDSQPSEDQILNSLSILQQALNSAKELNNSVLINDAYYGLYLCYSRLNKSSEAADQLIKLRKSLESVRSGIADPLERGGVFQTYPYLFYSSVEHLFKAKRYDDMLDAIEGSKGRVITDTLEKVSALDFEDDNLYNIRERLQPLLSRENAHYLSYHVDDDCSYASFVTKNGDIYSYQIPVGKDLLANWYNKNLNDPLSWENQFKKVEIVDELVPFLSWLVELFKKGVINMNDHICYSADHLLYLFPLHFLEIDQKSLIEICTLSRVHNAGHLIHLLSDSPYRPEHCLTIEVPSTDDIKKSRIVQLFGKSSSQLEAIYGSDYDHLHHLEASLKKVVSGCKREQIIHFSSHGFFPLHDNPFDNSGLLLSDNDKLPTLHKHDPNYKYRDDVLHLLSPERLLGGLENGQIEKCHISLQACVAGYAREGVGGDALGIEWAFFQKGASSIISTFWNIDIENANQFYKHFYEEWLNTGLTKAKAHQKAVLKLKDLRRQSDLPEEYFWAGYGLIGDWR